MRSGPFYGKTTHQADFTDKGPADPHNKSRDYALLNVPFDGQSTYKADFDKKKIPLRYGQLAPHIQVFAHIRRGRVARVLGLNRCCSSTCCR